MVLLEPLLTNIDAVNMPRPWVKWSYEPARAQEVPADFIRAYAAALQPPAGPVFLSLPLDDWDREMPEAMVESIVPRTVATRVGPDPERLAEFARRIEASVRPVLVYSSDIARSEAWQAGIAFAERLGAPVWTAPFAPSAPRFRKPTGCMPVPCQRPSDPWSRGSPATTWSVSWERPSSATTRSWRGATCRLTWPCCRSPTIPRPRPRRRRQPAERQPPVPRGAAAVEPKPRPGGSRDSAATVPGLDIPGIDIVSLARGYGAPAALARTADDVTAGVGEALMRPGASVVVVPITRRFHSLLG